MKLVLDCGVFMSSLFSGKIAISSIEVTSMSNHHLAVTLHLHWWTCYNCYLDQRLHHCHPRNPECVE